MKVLFVSPYFPSSDQPHISPFVGRLYNELDQHIDIDLFVFKAKRNVFNYFKARRELKQQLIQKDYDLVHINWGHTIAIVPRFISQKIVVSFRGSDVHGVLGKNGKQSFWSKLVLHFSRLAEKRAAGCIYVSKHLKEQLPTKKPFEIIPSGVDLTLFPKTSKAQLRQEFSYKDNEIILLFVGHPKNVGKRYSLAKQIVQDLNRPNVVLKHVWKSTPSEVYKQMKAADMLIQLSVQEGSPNIVKEALASNLKVVTTPVGDSKELLNGLQGCFIVKDLTQEAFKETLSNALDQLDRNLPMDYSDEVKNFTLESESRRIIEMYGAVIG